MQPKLVEIAPFIVSGVSVRVGAGEEEGSSVNVPFLWEQFERAEVAAKVPNQVMDGKVLNVYSDYELDASGAYTLTLGVEVSEAAKDFVSVQAGGGRYLVFLAKNRRGRE